MYVSMEVLSGIVWHLDTSSWTRFDFVLGRYNSPKLEMAGANQWNSNENIFVIDISRCCKIATAWEKMEELKVIVFNFFPAAVTTRFKGVLSSGKEFFFIVSCTLFVLSSRTSFWYFSYLSWPFFSKVEMDSSATCSKASWVSSRSNSQSFLLLSLNQT